MTTKFIPDISASTVAAIIGLHRYKPIAEAMYDVLGKDKTIKERMRAIERAHNRRSLYSVKNEALADTNIRDCVATALVSAESTTDMEPVLDEVARKAKIVVALRFSQYTPELQKLIVDDVRGQVARQRGTANENKILNTYEEEQKVEVTERNTRTFRKTYSNFKLVGRTDGYVASENRIVDSKDRVRFIENPPIYDEIQLRVYMNMADARESELVERFPDGRRRLTRYTNDADKWQAIEDGLVHASNTMQAALEDEEELKRIIFANTVGV
jgi:hypothetical protein